MKLRFAAALFALSLAPSLAFAGTFPIPAENPIATVSIPDSWSPNAYDGGVEGTSADGKLYVAFESVAANDVKSATEEGLKYYIKNGVEIDQSSMKTKDIKINSLDAFDLSFTGKDKDDMLTGREREILQLLADGMSNADVATKLFISQETVKSHVRHILAKLEADTRTHAVAIALREAIID